MEIQVVAQDAVMTFEKYRNCPLFVPGHGYNLAVVRLNPAYVSGEYFWPSFDIALVERTGPLEWRQVGGAATFTHQYVFADHLQSDDKQCSAWEMKFDLRDASTLYLWTWDPNTLYKLHIDPLHGITHVSTLSLLFNPVLKFNHGLNSYFSNDGSLLYLVSTCPWIHYEIDLDRFLFLRRSQDFMVSIETVRFGPLSHCFVVPGNASRSVLMVHHGYNSYDLHDVEHGRRAIVEFAKNDYCHIFPTSVNGEFGLLAVSSTHFTRLGDKSTLVDLDCLSIPQACTTQNTDPATGQFENEEELPYDDSSEMVTLSIALEWSNPLPFPRAINVFALVIQNKTYMWRSTQWNRGHAFIIDPDSLDCVRVVSPRYEAILRSISASGHLSWDCPFLLDHRSLQQSLRESLPSHAGGLFPHEDTVADLLAADRPIGSCPLAWELVLSSPFLSIRDAVRVASVLPLAARKAAFRSGTSRCQELYTRFLDFAIMATEFAESVDWIQDRAKSLMQFLISLEDDEAFVVLAESAYYATRGYDKDRVFAKRLLSRVKTLDSVVLHGKREVSTTIDIKSLRMQSMS
ncbi:hypothetical protein LEN26_019675 [Aphanomyces euteiches]|nr:hypothetical protein LEN26_019675 [Aphanomyces euteiches]KAH9126466.1 hypothetical protein AeMF1_003102 [Aphanomyces euteiches]KAH9190368.1 hypothetical protein AeNC1_007651 [Aphanomyces euteiches]